MPFSHGERLFEAANLPKQSLGLDGVKHAEVYAKAGQQLSEGVISFIRRLHVPS